jgi:hypothetical protein
MEFDLYNDVVGLDLLCRVDTKVLVSSSVRSTELQLFWHIVLKDVLLLFLLEIIEKLLALLVEAVNINLNLSIY